MELVSDCDEVGMRSTDRYCTSNQRRALLPRFTKFEITICLSSKEIGDTPKDRAISNLLRDHTIPYCNAENAIPKLFHKPFS